MNSMCPCLVGYFGRRCEAPPLPRNVCLLVSVFFFVPSGAFSWAGHHTEDARRPPVMAAAPGRSLW